MREVKPVKTLLAALLLLCAACARFENPILAESGPRFDEGLAGEWFAEAGDGGFELVIERNGGEGRLVTIETQGDKEPESDEFRIITARLDQQTFASVANLKEGSNWMLFRYELVPPDRLIIYPNDNTVLDAAVRDKLLPGKSDAYGSERDSTVTASSEELRAFVQGYGSVIFKDETAAEFRRLD